VLHVGELREATRERDREQEREEYLHAGQRDPELVQELDQLPIEPSSWLSSLPLPSPMDADPILSRPGHPSGAAQRPRSLVGRSVFRGDGRRESKRLTGTTRRREVSR
jgi:hypothetical protein